MANDIRKQAEALLTSSDEELKVEGVEDTQKLRKIIQELRIHQIELEIQNEELQNTRRELESARDIYSELYNFSPVGYFSFDTRGVILETNLTGANQLGIARHYLHNKPFILYLSHDSHTLFHNHLKSVINQGGYQTCELQIKQRSGNFFYAQMQSLGVADEKGLIYQVRSAVMDISGQKQAQLAKNHFLATMSHELRTPLVGILGLSEALQLQLQGQRDKIDLERAKKSARYIEESGRRLLNMINNMLDFSQIEFNSIELEFQAVLVEAICRAAIDKIQIEAQHKNLHISLNFDPAVETIRADEKRLKQVLNNLLNNAIKFTPAGGEIGLEIQGDAANARMYLTVWDSGIGISSQNIERLFKPFEQLDNRLERMYQGTGLGLSLAYRLVKIHGGDITVQSEENKGSRFIVTLPWHPTAY